MYSNTTWYVIIRSKPLTGVVAGRFPELKTTIRNAEGNATTCHRPCLYAKLWTQVGCTINRSLEHTAGPEVTTPMSERPHRFWDAFTWPVTCPGQASEKQLQRLSRICCLCCRHLWCMLPPQPIREKGMMFIYSRPAQCPFVSSCVAH